MSKSGSRSLPGNKNIFIVVNFLKFESGRLCLFNDSTRPHYGWCKMGKIRISGSLDCQKIIFEKSEYMS